MLEDADDPSLAAEVRRVTKFGEAWSHFPQPGLFTGYAKVAQSVYPRRQTVRRPIANRPRKECWELCGGSGELTVTCCDFGLSGNGVDLDEEAFTYHQSHSRKAHFFKYDLLSDSFIQWFTRRL